MSATPPAPTQEPGQRDHRPLHDAADDPEPGARASVHATATPPPSRRPDDADALTLVDAVIKTEDDSAAPHTETTLRPDPPPSMKRRESAAAPTPDRADQAHRKRKRPVSPPWHFPTAANSFVKTADGRRVSARVHTATPTSTPTAMSDSEGVGRARSASQSAGRSRPPSPPWKKFEADRPTSIRVDGVRKSGRVNKALGPAPRATRTSPRNKRTADTKTADEAAAPETKRYGRSTSKGQTAAPLDATPEAAPKKSGTRETRALSPTSKIADLQAQIATLKPTRSFPSPEVEPRPTRSAQKRKYGFEEPNDQIAVASRRSSPTTTRKTRRPSTLAASPDDTRRPRIKLRFSSQRQHVPPPHPHAQVPHPARPPQLSLHQVLDGWELKEMQQPYMENERGPPDADEFRRRSHERAVLEGQMRRKLLEAAQPNGVLSREKCSLYQAEAQDEPPKQYGHVDHLTTHALYLRQLQEREKTHHRQLAKKVAYEALDYWKAMRGPTEEDLMAEQDRIFKLIYKQCVADVRAKWEMVEKHVQDLRRQRWEAEEDARRQQRLQRQLEQAELMVAKQRGGDDEDDSDVEMADDDMDEHFGSDISDSDMGGEGDEQAGDDDSGAENMTESESEAESADDDEEGGEMTEDELAAYLAHREAEPPDKRNDGDEQGGEDSDIPIEPPTTADLLAESPKAAKSPADRVMENHVAADHDRPATAELLGDASQDDTEDQDQDGYETAEEHNHEHAEEDAATLRGQAESDTRTYLRHSRSDDQAVEENTDDNLSEDESVEMYDSDEDMSSSAEEDEGDDDESAADDSGADEAEEAQNSMLGFLFSSSKIKKAVGLPTPTTSAEGDARDRTAEPVSEDNADSHLHVAASESIHAIKEEAMGEASETVETGIARECDRENATELVNGDVSAEASGSHTTVTSSATAVKSLTPAPRLLRGTLRSYQQAGLDWLASLHRNHTNGILADEMGLGKTIQTIALLAHLAEEKGIWDTHLVIVPTSVILNWVTEFQKFLPGFRVLGYYGTAEERKMKRNHWVNDPHIEKDKRGYNVVITSYNVAMQDINAIRNVQWHYLVLDEAHNIRNFNSQRWQVLIRLKTKARLLLTGTPLQNSLSELWSLLTFLTAGDDDPAHGDLEEFLSHWKEPVKEIFDRGVSTLSAEAQKVVDQLHVSLRPFLLRRLKTEVEKDLPKKTESVVVCKLSKRQRQLYEEYMSLASTRESLTRGNAVSAGKVLLSLRRVCNHPDLFDPRPIQTSFAMEKSPVAPFAVKETLIRRLLGDKSTTPACLMLVALEERRRGALTRSRQLTGTHLLQQQVEELTQASPPEPELSTLAGSQAIQYVRQREKKLQHLRDRIQVTEAALRDTPVYGSDLRELLTIRNGTPYAVTQRQRGLPALKHLRAWPAIGPRPLKLEHLSDWHLSKTTALQRDVLTLDRVGDALYDTITRFAFCPPVATAPILNYVIPHRAQQLLRASEVYPVECDYAHEARSRTSIAFPDSRLLIYDSGKLQRLTTLLRELQAKGSRSLIFTQMTGTLNVLEQFLNLLNLPYLRLDGSTTVERRQLYAAEFNRPDSKYQCMILSSRAGGVGLNLVGASSVIFFDLDWNPQMDRQCMDRAHRIGQVRDVEVYKMVSEKTVEENILRRANQKSLLDQTVIQEGHFTTEYRQPPARRAKASDADSDDEEEDVEAAIDRFLGSGDKATNQAIESVEDKEDVAAAKKATAEEHQDDNDFAERSSKGPSQAATPGPGISDGEDEGDEDGRGHVDGYMIRVVDAMMKDIPFIPPAVRKLDKHGRDPSHRPKKRR